MVERHTTRYETFGTYKFRGFLRDDAQMPRIVEKFVRNFYDREQDRFSVGRDRLEQRAVIERPVGEPVEGMLLYPVVERTLDLEYEVDGRRVRVCTVDWRRELRGIRRRLLGVL